MIILLINHTTQNDPNAMLTMNTALDKLVKQAIPCTWGSTAVHSLHTYNILTFNDMVVDLVPILGLFCKYNRYTLAVRLK